MATGPAEATLLTTVVSLDPVYAYFDADEQIYLKYTTGGARSRGSIDRRIRMALANEDGYPHEGQLDFLDNQLDSTTGTIRGRAVFRNTDGLLTPGLFVRLRLAGAGSYHGLLIQDRAVGTDLEQEVRLRRLAGEPGRVPAGDAGADRRGPARRAKRSEGRRAGRRQRSAADPAGSPGATGRMKGTS